MERRIPDVRRRPPSLTASLPILAAALVGAAGIGVLSVQPPRFDMTPQLIAGPADPLVPVDALGVAHHDFAFVSGDRDVQLDRLMYGARRTVWHTRFDREVRLTGAIDLLGNGFDAICVATTDSTGPAVILLDRDGQRLARLSPTTERGKVGEDLAGVRVCAFLALSQQGRRKVLCGLERGSESSGGELMLFDVATETVDWSVPVGAAPRSVVRADLDGDGRGEFLVATISSADSASAAADSGRCGVLALRESGAPMWRVPLSSRFALAGALTLPQSAPHGAGAIVIATSRPLNPDDRQSGRVEILDGTSGRVLAALAVPSGLGRPVGLGESGPRFVVGSRDGVLRLFDLGLKLRRQRRFDGPVEVQECADLDRDGVPEVVVSTRAAAFVLDGNLRTLARLRYARPAADVPGVRVASAGLGNSRLCVSGDPALVAGVTGIPPLSDPLRVPWVGGLALAAGLAVRWRLRRGSRELPSGTEAREFLLDYHQIRHETFGRERPFARVRLWAQAQVAGHALPAEVLESARDEYRRIGAPTLLRFARRARELGVDSARVRRVERLSKAVAESLETACSAPVGRVQTLVEASLATMTALSGECLGAYREVALRDLCRPDLEAQEAILAKRATLDQHGVALLIQVDPSGKQPVLFDSSELRALVGELIENAARALSGTEGAEIAVTVVGKPGDARWLVMRIADNGPGIPPERREAVFAPDGSTHPEGGFGLRRAREIAQRWLADLSLEEPAQGQGAVVKLSLRTLLPHDAAAAAGVSPHPPAEGEV